MATEEIKIVTVVDDGGSRKTIRELQQEVKSYRNGLLNLERGTKEYNETLKALAQSQGRINTINQDVRASTQNLTDVYATLTRTTAGIVGGFNAIQGAAALLGSENEELAQTFVKLQAGMAVVQGLQSFSTAIKSARIAMIAFNATVAANPLGALLIVVVAITGALASLFAVLSSNKSGVDELSASFNEYNRTLEESQAEQDFLIRKQQAAGVQTKELIASNQEFTRETIRGVQDRLTAINAEIAILQERTRWWNFGDKKRLKELKRQQEELVTTLETQQNRLLKLNQDYEVQVIKEETDARNKSKQERDKANQDRLKEQERLLKELAKQEQDYNDAVVLLAAEREKVRKAEAKASTEDESRIEYLRNELSINEALREEYTRQMTDPSISLEARTEATKALIAAEKEMNVLRKEILTTETEVYENRIELERLLKEAEGYGDLSAEEIRDLKRSELQEEIDSLWEIANNTEESYNTRIDALNKWNKAQKDAQKIDNQIKKEEEKLMKDRLDVTVSFLSAASKALGENTVAGKAIAVAGATIDTYRAGAQALAAFPPPLSYAALAATIATGIANVRSIISTKVPGQSDSGSDSISPEIPSFPQIETGIQETYTNLNPSDIESLNTMGRVYVLESDVTETQSRVRAAESESTY